ncbi:MAG: hypothetical protein JZU55_10170 [Afipia sp.]|jgi:hypothetical protein|nr:hypothetical protein [Afipia sp.]
MRKTIPIAVIALVLAAPGVLAQNKSGTSGPATPSAASGSSTIPQAPIGHRQPRANEVPSAEEKGYVESPEDKALDRKIKSICRGC